MKKLISIILSLSLLFSFAVNGEMLAFATQGEISSISFEPKTPYSYIENMNGFNDTNGVWNEETGEVDYVDFYHYYDPHFSEGDTLSVTYSDDIVKAFTYKYDYYTVGDYAFFADDGEYITTNEVNIYSNQYENPWTVGGKNYVFVTYNEIQAQVPVTVKKNPVKSISYKPIKALEYIENTNGYYTSSSDSTKYFVYSFNYADGDILKVTYTDGRIVNYVFNNTPNSEYHQVGFTSSKGEFIPANDVSVRSNQSENHWTAGGKYSFTVEYLTKKGSIPVSILKSPVTSITASPAKNILTLDMIWFEPLFDVSISYNDGTTKTFKNVNSSREINDGLMGVRLNVSYPNEVAAGTNEVVIEYGGAKTTTTMEVVEQISVESYTIQQIKCVESESMGAFLDRGSLQFEVTYSDASTAKATEFELLAGGETECQGILYGKYLTSFAVEHIDVADNNYHNLKNGCTFNIIIGGIKNQIVLKGHNYKDSKIAPTCTKKGYTTHTCSICKKKYTDSYVNAKGHKLETITTKATTTKDGKIVKKCSVCNAVTSTTVIPKASSVTISSTKYTYDGNYKNPTVTVKDSKGKKLSTANYSVAYSNNKYVGKASVKITFKGNYSGTKTLYFTINPKSTTISSLTATSKGFKVNWKKQSTQTSGYQIQYATNSRFDNAKLVTVSGNSTTSKTISKLTAKKKYYVRVRTYKTVNGTKYYSAWSTVKTVTTKK